ncbi:MAG: mechanosensitive ion channel family protein [Acidobacteriota bacterium]
MPTPSPSPSIAALDRLVRMPLRMCAALVLVFVALSAAVASAQVPLLDAVADAADDAEVRSADARPVGAASTVIDDDTDDAIRSSLRRRYDQLGGLKTVAVEVDAGIVMLRGPVLGDDLAGQAVALAEATEGVVLVIDRIEVVINVRQRLAPTLAEAARRLQTVLSYLPLLLLALVLLGVFAWLSRAVRRWDSLFRRLFRNALARDLARQTASVLVLLAGILVALELLDATALVGAVLGTAGIIGLAVGFAFRDLVENYIASVLLSVRQPFAASDFVAIDDHEGKVVRLTSRATILMTFDGNHLRIPNSQVFKGVVLNYSRNPLRRFGFTVGVGVGEDLRAAQQLGVDVLHATEGVLDEPGPLAFVESLGDSSVVVRFFAWIDQTEASFVHVRSESILRVKQALEAAGMDLPEPIYRLHLTRGAELLAASDETDAPATARSTSTMPDADPAPTAYVSAQEAEDAIERQIAAERARADGDDLLQQDAPQE